MRTSSFLSWIYALFSLTFLLSASCGSSQVVASPTLDAPSKAGPEVTFMPENELHLDDSMALASMSEAQFNSVLSKLRSYYAPIISKFGATLKIIGKWNDSTVNAYAYQRGGTWYVEIFGGLARRPELSVDGLALVVCHELGHHLGGFPGYTGGWASSEGQSDYYATQACAKKIWGGEDYENQEAYEVASYDAIEYCERSSLPDYKVPLCVRTVDASIGLATLLGNGASVSPLTPDSRVVSRTQTSHPQGQCRLDTYARGAICKAGWYDRVIPKSEYESSKYTCTRDNGLYEGARPLCWFKPSR